MGEFIKIVTYSCICSLSVLISGMKFPRKFVDYTSKVFRPKKWEADNKIYSILKVSAWKDKLPDMSKILKKLPNKQVKVPTMESVKALINETCVAEISHMILIGMSVPISFLCEGISGFIYFMLYGVLGNLPFIIIQRYNRPRLIKLLNRLENKDACINTDVQHRRRA